MLKDFFGNEIQEGDTIVYPTISKGRAYVNIGVVLKVDDERIHMQSKRLLRNNEVYEYFATRATCYSNEMIKVKVGDK